MFNLCEKSVLFLQSLDGLWWSWTRRLGIRWEGCCRSSSGRKGLLGNSVKRKKCTLSVEFFCRCFVIRCYSLPNISHISITVPNYHFSKHWVKLIVFILRPKQTLQLHRRKTKTGLQNVFQTFRSFTLYLFNCRVVVTQLWFRFTWLRSLATR